MVLAALIDENFNRLVGDGLDDSHHPFSTFIGAARVKQHRTGVCHDQAKCRIVAKIFGQSLFHLAVNGVNVRRDLFVLKLGSLGIKE